MISQLQAVYIINKDHKKEIIGIYPQDEWKNNYPNNKQSICGFE